jgi:membrane protease subunit HflC
MKRAMLALLVTPLVGGLLTYNSIYVVNEREQVAIVRFGKVVDVRSEPGLYFKLPFAFVSADRIHRFEDRALRLDLANIRLQVSGGKLYEVDAFIVYRIDDVGRFLQQLSGDVDAGEARLRTRLDAALRNVYGLHGFEAALSTARRSMMDQVGDQLRPAAKALGLGIVDVQIARTDLTEEVQQQTHKRMKAERFAEAELIRARGREAAQRIRAVADRLAVEVLSKARRQGEVLRGEGDAERTRIYAGAHARAPRFFAFYRSMKAYEEALHASNTTMVLSTSSEFFRYFRAPYANDVVPEGRSRVPDDAVSMRDG